MKSIDGVFDAPAEDGGDDGSLRDLHEEQSMRDLELEAPSPKKRTRRLSVAAMLRERSRCERRSRERGDSRAESSCRT